MNFGTKQIAQAAADHHDDRWENDAEGSPDFRLLGYGCARSAYLHVPTSTVYKVLHYGNDPDNERELAASERLRKFIWEAVYIPKMSGHMTHRGMVLAVEYIDAPLAEATPSGSAMKGRREMMTKARFSDMHGMNFLVLNNICIPIDMGHPSGESANPDNRALTCGDGRYW